jgi:hypothetical protein
MELGLCQLELGIDKAADSLQQALQLDPECDGARRALRRGRPGGLFRRLKFWWRKATG